LKQSSHRLLLQGEYGNNAKWVMKTLDMSTEEINFRTADLKTYSKAASFCITTVVPIQLPIWLTTTTMNSTLKQIETEFEEQWKIYTDNLKESLLVMDNRLLLMNSPIFTQQQQQQQQIDVQWLSPVEVNLKNNDMYNGRICCKLEGSFMLRAYITTPKITGNELRQYFIEDLFRTMLIRFNLALINTENENENKSDTKFLTNTNQQIVLPRRFYTVMNREKTLPLFITGYQLSDETIQTVVDCVKENFHLELDEEDLEAGEEFPLELTTTERTKQFNTTMTNNKSSGNTSLLSSRNLMEKLMQYGSKNVVLTITLITIIVGLVSIMLKMF
ncbi:unnamed protein product, partial [Didymodactylos carnosus]